MFVQIFLLVRHGLTPVQHVLELGRVDFRFSFVLCPLLPCSRRDYGLHAAGGITV